jgi:hypothetical protein
VLDLRLYRASLLPFALALLVAAFSLVALPHRLAAEPAQGPLDPAGAFAGLQALARADPARAPGSRIDDQIARRVAASLRADGYAVRERWSVAVTVAGTRRIATVVASQPGRGGAIVLVAHRDGAGAASLSGTAMLLALGHALAGDSGRPLELVSTSGGSGGNAGAYAALRLPRRSVDAVIALGDVATTPQGQILVPWSPAGAAAPLVLQRTLAGALAAQLEAPLTRPGVGDELARFALPLTIGEQAPFAAAGQAAILVQASGERPPSPHAPLSQYAFARFARGLLAAIASLERGPAVGAPTRDLVIDADVVSSSWMSAISGLLLAAVALASLDALARARRRRTPLRPWLVWLAWWAAPVLGVLLAVKLLGAAGALSPLPPGPVTDSQLPIGAGGAVILALALAGLCAACLLRARLVRWPEDLDGAPVVLGALASLLALVLWLADPYTSLLLTAPLAILLPVLHSREYRPLSAGLVWLAVALAPLGLALALEAVSLGLGPLGFFWTWLLVLASAQAGAGATLALTLAAALALAAGVLLLSPRGRGIPTDLRITVRGPLGYAGPGSLGGTPSAR